MSGIVSGITKAFTAVGNATARVGQAVLGVGATTFTAGAASGAGPLASGGLAGIVQKFTGTGVLGNVLTGAITQAGYGALIGGAVSAATGGSFGKGALTGALGGAVSGGLMGAAGLNPDPLTRGFGKSPDPGVDTGIVTGSTATGLVPTGSTTAPVPLSDAAFNARAGGAAAAAPAAVEGGSGFSRFMNSPMAGGLVSGLGQGLAGWLASKEKKQAEEDDRNFIRERDQRLTDSYNVAPSALHAPMTDNTARPVPAQKYARPRWQYDRESGRMVQA